MLVVFIAPPRMGVLREILLFESRYSRDNDNRPSEEGLRMAEVKVVIFDFIGSLASVKNYSLEASTLKLHKAMVEAGFRRRSSCRIKTVFVSSQFYSLKDLYKSQKSPDFIVE
jgi:hypothetical protein